MHDPGDFTVFVHDGKEQNLQGPGGEAYQQLSEALDALRSLLNVS